MAPCIDQVKEFLIDTRKVAWFADADLKVYMRKSKRFIEGELVSTLDIATVETRGERQCQGVFSAFLSEVTALNPFPVLYVENVMTERFSRYFESRGWKPQGLVEEWQLPCFYLYT